MKFLKTIVAAAAVSILAMAPQAFAQGKGLVGIAKPPQYTLRGLRDGARRKAAG